MPRTRAAERHRAASAALVSVAGRHQPLSREAVRRAAATVLRRERRRAVLSLSFVGRERMRDLNARWKGRPGPTDVLAFRLSGPDGTLAGDIYICRWVAAREARDRGISLGEELLRLVVHGVLHVLGYDHPAGADRTGSAMWRRQERYLSLLR